METRQVLETGVVLISVVTVCLSLFGSTNTEFELYITGYLVCGYCVIFLHQISPFLIAKDKGRKQDWSIYRPGCDGGIWTCILVPLAILLDRQSSDLDVNVMSQYYVLLTIAVSLVWYNPTSHTQIVTALMLLWFRSYLAQQGIQVLLVLGVFCYMFYMLIRRLPETFRLSFTEGEMAVVTQILTYVLIRITLCAFKGGTFIGGSATKDESVFVSVIVFEGVLISTLLLCMLNVQKHPQWFYIVYGAVGVSVVLPLSLYLLGPNLLTVIYHFIRKTITRVYLLLFWTMLAVLSAAVVYLYNTESHHSISVSTGSRKYFHLIIVAVYVPGIYFDPELLYTASVVALGVLVMIETVRLYKVPPFGRIIHDAYRVFIDKQDRGHIVLTPIYLLVGMSVPLWITTHTNTVLPLKYYSGVLSVGIGDSAASIFGSLYGKHCWPGCKKTVEGTLASVIFQLITVFILQEMGKIFQLITVFILQEMDIPGPSSPVIIVAIVLTSLLESFTVQIDNLILPLFMYCLLSL